MKKRNIIITTIIIIILAIVVVFLYKIINEKNKTFQIEKVENYKYFLISENEKFGVIDENGNKIIDAKYLNIKIPNPEKPVFVCYENNVTKILNEKEEQLFTEYDSVEPLRLKNISSDLMYEKSILKYSKNGKYGLIDFNGKKITNAIYEEIDTLQYKEGELLVKQNGKYGIINIKGTKIIKPNYDTIEADQFYEKDSGYKNDGYIVSKTTDEGYRYGYVDNNGKEIVSTKYNDLSRINEISGNDIYNICAENGKYGLLKNGKIVISNEYQSLMYSESNNTLIAKKGKKYGVLSLEGDIIVPFSYNQISVNGKYIYAVDNNENTTVFSPDGKQTDMNENIQILNVENTNYQIRIETLNERTMYSVYENDKKITETDYSYIQYLFDNYFIASNGNGKLGIIDTTNNKKLEFDYSSIQIIDDTNLIKAIKGDTTEIYSNKIEKICEMNNAIIENNESYIKIYNDNDIKYISSDEKLIDNTELFKENRIFAKKLNNKWGFVNVQGNVIVDYIYDMVTDVNKYGYAGIKQNGKWGVIDRLGKVKVEPTYEINSNQPEFIGPYYQVIYGNGEIYYTK